MYKMQLLMDSSMPILYIGSMVPYVYKVILENLIFFKLLSTGDLNPKVATDGQGTFQL
jgi:hypothetical protein